jgi:acetyltransferase
VTIVLADQKIHLGIVWLQLMDAYVDTLVEIFEELKTRTAKPLIVCWVAAPDRALQALRARGVAVLRGAEPAVDAAAALAGYAETRRGWLADTEDRAALMRQMTGRLARESQYARGVVSTVDAAQWLNEHHVMTAKVKLARNAEEAVAAAATLGYPVALKIESPDVHHKTEVHGVKLSLADADAVRRAFDEVMANIRRHRPQAKIDGVIVQRMAHGDVELVVGLQHDPVFGLVIMVGLGGVHVELLKDVAFRAVPVTPAEAARMLDELRAHAIFDGVRGSAPVDRAALTRFVSAVSVFGAAAGPRLKEFDLNPVFASVDGVIAVDWLMVLDDGNPSAD